MPPFKCLPSRTAWLIEPSLHYALCIAGGLPHGWLGTNKVFDKIQYIDLSGNFLGHSTWPGDPGNRYANTYGPTPDVASHWCQAGPTTSSRSGWCPRDASNNAALTPLAGLPALLFLDISDNGFQGTCSSKTQWRSAGSLLAPHFRLSRS